MTEIRLRAPGAPNRSASATSDAAARFELMEVVMAARLSVGWGPVGPVRTV